MENNLTNSENNIIQPKVQDDMKERLGSKYVGENVTLTDNISNKKFKIVSLNNDGLIIREIVGLGKGEETPISYDDLLNKFDKSEISVAGYENTESDKIIFHQVIREIRSGHNMTEKDNAINEKNNEINELVTEESEFNSGGVIGKITYNRNGTVKEIKNRFGKIISDVKVGDKYYNVNLIKKTYTLVGGDEVLRKEDADKIKIVKKGETKKEEVKDDKDAIEEFAKNIINNEILAVQSSLVEKLLSSDNGDCPASISIDEIQNYYHYNVDNKLTNGSQDMSQDELDEYKKKIQEKIEELESEDKDATEWQDHLDELEDIESKPQEILEWWLISDWLKDKLLAEGEPIIDSDLGTWWGRTTSGQQIIMDGVIQSIVRKMNPEKLIKGKRLPSAKTIPVDTRYNGWKNYETWNVKLWMDNEAESQRHWNERATEIYNDSKKSEYHTKKQEAAYTLQNELKEYFDDNNPLSDQASTYADLLNGALREVDWREIADNLLAEKKSEGGEMETGGEVGEEFRYLKLIPKDNGLEIKLTKEGRKKVKEDGLTYKNADEYFEDIQGNSEYIYHNDMGQSGFGMTNAEGITDGYHYEDNGYETDYPKSAKIYWFPNYQIQFWGDILKDEGSVFFIEAKEDGGYMEKGGRVDITSNFYRFRQHSPKGVTECAIPQWGKKVAESVKSGAEITTCKKDGKWFVQSIMIPKDGINASQARKFANEIKSKFSRKKKALGGVAETCTDEDIEKTKKGLRVLIESSTNESERKNYEKVLQDLD